MSKSRKTGHNPTTSQYSYMVTGLLSAKVQRNGTITQEDVKAAVETAKMAYDLISELIGEVNDEETEPKKKKEKEPMLNYFQDYEWKDGKATWSELNAYLKKQGISSNRRISNIFKESIEKGYIRRDENTRQYMPPLP